MLMGGGTLLRVRVSSVLFVLTEERSFLKVRLIRGKEKEKENDYSLILMRRRISIYRIPKRREGWF